MNLGIKRQWWEKGRLCLVFLAILLGSTITGYNQSTTIIDSSAPGQRTVIAGAEYARSGWHQFLWGKDYRREWNTPLTVPVLNLDSAFGGLTPVELGGGRQTKSLHMKDAAGRRYVLRTINKTYSAALPSIAKGTFVEKLANDQTATIHPFAAFAIPSMAEAAGVYHTNPKLYLVPSSPPLGEFNRIFANTLCMLEERPDKTQAGQQSFGLPKDIDGSESMVENITEDNDVQMDQHFYLKTRLFDMLIGDWGRHIDNWRWAQFDSGKKEIYRPVPKDRDQTWALFQGVLLNTFKSLAGLKQLQSFKDKIDDVAWYNFPAIELDRRFTNSITRQEWLDSARALQQYLTDSVIENGIMQLPPEIAGVSGNEILHKLKERRDELPEYVEKYYKFLSRQVDIPGSKKNELFTVQRLNDDSTLITIHKITKDGEVKDDPIYSRTFLTKETEEVRLFGIDGNDVFHIQGNVDKSITVRIIGGPGKDSLVDQSHVSGGTHRTKYYDNRNNSIVHGLETKIRLAGDSVRYAYDFDKQYEYDKKGFGIKPGYNTFYRFYLGIGYSTTKHGWREEPFKAQHKIGINYSIVENSFHPYYKGLMPNLFGQWNLSLAAGYDQVRRINYFGIGNETIKQKPANEYYWLRTQNLYASTGLGITVQKHHTFSFNLMYDGVKVRSEGDHFTSRLTVDGTTFDWKHFGSGQVSYNYKNVNDPIVPSKGLNVTVSNTYTQNIEVKGRHFNNVAAAAGFYLPLFKPFSLAIKTGAARLKGTPEFYQLNNIGGYYSLRGYRRYRFWAQEMFYNQNELRWLPNVKSIFFNGRAGLVALFDHGRVWQPGETSGEWHYGYGGGIILVPFNKFSATVTYAISPEATVFNIHLGTFF